MIKIKDKRTSMLLIIPLTLILGLIFFLQREYFTQEGQGFGTAMLIAILALEIISHISLFRSGHFLAKAIFTFISISLILFSSFITYAVLLNLSASEREKSDTINDSSNTKRILLVDRINSIKEEIKSKRNTIAKIQGTKRGWMIYKINSDIRALNGDWKTEQNKYLAVINNPKKVKSSIIGNLSKQTGIDATLVSMINKAFISFLLSLIPISLCYLIASSYKKKESKKVGVRSIPTKEKKTYEKILIFEQAARKLKVTKEEIAYRMGISLSYLKELEGKAELPKTIENRLKRLMA